MQNKTSIPTVLITGAGSGIGLAVAQLFYRQGYRTFLLGRTGTKIDQAVTNLKKYEKGREDGENNLVQGFTADVKDDLAIDKLFQSWKEEGLSIDILINNAGVITPIASITDSSPDEWLDTLKINLYGAYLCARKAIPGMLQKGGGTIINISSGAAHHPLEGWSAYCSSKAGLHLFTACLHEEYGSSGIRVFSFRPGMVDTPMQKSIRQSGINRVSRVKKEELLSPELSARGIVYLSQAGEEYQGQEVDIQDSNFRHQAGIE